MVKKKVSQQHYTFFLYFVGSGSMAVAARRRQHSGSGGQLGSRGGSLAEAQLWRQRQRIKKRGSSAAVAATRHQQWQHGVC